MSLHTYPALVQGSDEWLEARRGIVLEVIELRRLCGG